MQPHDVVRLKDETSQGHDTFTVLAVQPALSGEVAHLWLLNTAQKRPHWPFTADASSYVVDTTYPA